ncbi:inositol monophosphatase [Corynebacterium lizhenjunii]|uniref:Inositol-1-monophosphatase n=1 Tax=Corynebacterium lizhenjunii TaxID=2709394 RepID=A0A7T0KDX5_9CORY|nr:inositol monophosphatase family protein [Corynebacterium lizhenjunii]QPK78324.1 inositol monophosphatase [Corynebacterium lizhenjunii]
MSTFYTATTPAPVDCPAVLITQLRELALAAARSAGELVSRRRRELLRTSTDGGLQAHHTKTSAVDPVTVVDTESENHIVAFLRQHRPDDGFLGEEGQNTPGRTGVTWVIDPIDGTVNFLYGIGEYAVSVGAVVDGEPVAGAVVNVESGAAYHAGWAQGAAVERGGASHALTPRSQSDLALALVATGFGYQATRREAQARLLAHILPVVRDIRRMGAAALDLCRVAEGTVDAYYEHGVKAWDCAAGTIIAREAGVVVAHPGMEATGGEARMLFAAQPGVAPQLWSLLESLKVAGQLPE